MDINTLYVQTQGSFRNEAVLFLHGFPLSSEMWKDQMSVFSKTHYTLAPDLPGFGKGLLPIHAIMFEHYADSMIKFLKQTGIKHSVWCGLSMGGYLALRMYEKAPELCSGLILANTKAPTDDNAAKLKRWETIKMLHSHRGEFEEAQWKAMVAPHNLENMELKKRFSEILAKNSEEGMSAGLATLASRMDLTEMLAKIHVPTLIIGGSEDKVIPVKELEFLHHNIPDSQLEIIQNVGHLSNMENPYEFNKLVSEFFTNLHTVKLQESLMD